MSQAKCGTIRKGHVAALVYNIGMVSNVSFVMVEEAGTLASIVVSANRAFTGLGEDVSLVLLDHTGMGTTA